MQVLTALCHQLLLNDQQRLQFHLAEIDFSCFRVQGEFPKMLLIHEMTSNLLWFYRHKDYTVTSEKCGNYSGMLKHLFLHNNITSIYIISVLIYLLYPFLCFISIWVYMVWHFQCMTVCLSYNISFFG